MAGVLFALLLIPLDVEVRSADAIQSLAWHPNGKSLYWVTSSAVHEWPGGRRIPLSPTRENETRWLGRVCFSANGRQILIADTYGGRSAIVDLGAGHANESRREIYFRWWIGNDVASVLPEIKDESWTGRQFLEFKGKRRELPGGWEFCAASAGGTVLLAKKRGWYEGPIALFRLDPKTLEVKQMAAPRSKQYVEYIEQDSIAWNESLKIAAIGLTCDTGATLSQLHFIRNGQVADFPANNDLIFLESEPKWIGGRVLATMREFRESSIKTKGFGADIYRIQRIDPITLKAQTLVLQENRWTWSNEGPFEDTNSLDEVPNRQSMPTLGACDMTADGKRLAWVIQHRGKYRIAVRQLH